MESHAPAAGQPTRCLLFPNPLLAGQISSLAVGKHVRLQRSLTHPSVIIDVGDDGIRVIDPTSNALTASASAALATATPITSQPMRRQDDGMDEWLNTVPAMIVAVPGLEPITVGCREFKGAQLRFTWCGDVPLQHEQPAYAVSGGDWLALAETFGLTGQLNDTAAELA